jgi:hypothetical protein
LGQAFVDLADALIMLVLLLIMALIPLCSPKNRLRDRGTILFDGPTILLPPATLV